MATELTDGPHAPLGYVDAIEQAANVCEEEANQLARWLDGMKGSAPNRATIAAIREIRRLRNVADVIKRGL